MDTLFHPTPQIGLTAEQIKTQKRNGKQNTLPQKVTKTTGRILRDNICTLFNLYNVLIAVALAFVGAWSNMLFILIITLNILIGIVQELHAKKSVEQLSLLSAPTVKVIRDSAVLEILVQELVEEDVMELEAGLRGFCDFSGRNRGQRIPFDGRIRPHFQSCGRFSFVRQLYRQWKMFGQCGACRGGKLCR